MSDEQFDEDRPSQQGVKRAQDANDGPATKKTNYGNGGDDDGTGGDHLSIKLLIPSNAVGAIIGKGGETMRSLKTDHNCRVQMSKSTETYPGTSERICLLKGRVLNILAVVEIIQEKIREKCSDQTGTDQFDQKHSPRANSCKIVMPNTSAGMVIGKSGANIKDIRENIGCQIQVYPKVGSAEAQNTPERVVTVANDDDKIMLQAVSRVLEKVASDPHHASEINKEDFGKYSGGTSVGIIPPNNNHNNTQINIPFNGGGNGVFNSGQSAFNNGPNVGGGGGGPNISFNSSFGGNAFGSGPGNVQGAVKYPMSGLGNNELLSFLDNLQSTLRTSGFNESSVSEVMQAMQVLAKYNIMGLGLGLGVAAMAQMRTGQEVGQNHGSAGFGDNGGQGGSGYGGEQQSYWRR
ncbi:unnamed protein product [Caenorhabditis angaria]|uniref:K Homology domain-containing protein n=1 Tax=Caenorhabditis angaria TaxID=860376 RepID=A0A9P1N4N4_9PELO|nr:unnamed protein product [Caenorhabditis angaria]